MNIIKTLRIIYVCELLTAALIALVFETSLLIPGTLAGDEELAYWLSIIGVALTIILLPLSLRLFKFERVKRAVAKSEHHYLRWSVVRLGCLALPLLYNLVCYYLLGCEPTYGYLALMIVVAYIFIWPSRDKMVYEREQTYSQEEP